MRISPARYPLKSCMALVVLISSGLVAQTFDNPDAEIESGLESAAAEPVNEAELDEALEEYLEEEQPQLEEQISEGGEFDSFVPSEDISEDYSVPFPVDI